jgi:hypothetical protein
MGVDVDVDVVRTAGDHVQTGALLVVEEALPRGLLLFGGRQARVRGA